MTDIPFRDPDKDHRLAEAIKLGFINMTTDPDGMTRYELTDKGLQQWVEEYTHRRWKRYSYYRNDITGRWEEVEIG